MWPIHLQNQCRLPAHLKATIYVSAATMNLKIAFPDPYLGHGCGTSGCGVPEACINDKGACVAPKTGHSCSKFVSCELHHDRSESASNACRSFL